MSRRTDDPIADFLRYDAELQQEQEKLPHCTECDKPITADCCYEFNDELLCPDCLDKNHRKLTDDYLEY